MSPATRALVRSFLIFAVLAAEVRAQACVDPSQLVPLYRAYNPSTIDHFYTTSFAESQNASGYIYEGIRAMLYTTQVDTTVELYRYTDTHGYTIENQTPMFIYPTQQCGSVPFYRLYNQPGGDHFYTINETEAQVAEANGWNYEFIAGYVFAPSTSASSTAASVTSSPNSSPSTTSVATLATHKTSTGLIAGVVVAVVAVAVISLLIFLRLRRSRNRRHQTRELLDPGRYSSEPKAAAEDPDSHLGEALNINPFTPVSPPSTYTPSMLTLQNINNAYPSSIYAPTAVPTAPSDIGSSSGRETVVSTPSASAKPLSKAAAQRQEFLTNQLASVQAQLAALEREREHDDAEAASLAGADAHATALQKQNTAMQARIQMLEQQLQSQWAQGLSDDPPPGYMAY